MISCREIYHNDIQSQEMPFKRFTDIVYIIQILQHSVPIPGWSGIPTSYDAPVTTMLQDGTRPLKGVVDR